MNIHDFNQLEPLLKKMREAGVRAFSIDGDKLHVEFDAPIPQADETKPPEQPEKCVCGHPVWEHTNGLCMHCSPEACVEKAAAS